VGDLLTATGGGAGLRVQHLARATLQFSRVTSGRARRYPQWSPPLIGGRRLAKYAVSNLENMHTTRSTCLRLSPTCHRTWLGARSRRVLTRRSARPVAR
jgi:hypothetical protein